MTDLQELHELVATDPLPQSRPDIGSLIRQGRRFQHRRRAVYGAAGVAALVTAGAALGSTHGLGGEQGRKAHDGFADESHTSTPQAHHSHSVTPPADLCPVAGGIFVCEQPPRESRTPVGDVVHIEHQTDAGDPEVLYAVQQRGVDLRTGTAATVISVHAGLQRSDGLHGAAIGLQPGSGPDLRIPMTGGTQDGRYAIAGAVKNGAFDSITWTDADGITHPVTGLSTTMVPGWTVFWLYGSQGQGPAYDFDKVVVHAGATSCALSECAVQGAL